jgi:HD-like signal output (HDOD) protein/DNA-binding response OmpR family regulator
MEKHSQNTEAKDASQEASKPVILLFSTRERIGDILNVALMQCNYRIINSNTPYLAMIKANQFLPDLVIADITPNNTKDTLLISRLQKSFRTKSIPVLVVIPGAIKHLIEPMKKDGGEDTGVIHLLEYPFNFADLLKNIESIMSTSHQTVLYTGSPEIDTANADKVIAPKLYDQNVPLETKLRAVESVIHRQWAFPFTVIKALDIIGSDASCCNELAKCIETDLAASTAILKVANAVYYAKRGSRVTEVKEAVVRLGFRETNNLLACLALIDLSPEHRKNYGFSRDEFWLHSLAVALIAEKLCTDCGHIKPELGFITGLIHDLGKIPLDNNFEMLFPRLLEETTSSVTSFYKTEIKLLGFSHAELGHYLTTKWNFPATVSMGILNHHKPNLILETPTPMDRIVQESVFVADILAKAMSLGHSCDEILEEIPSEMLRDLHMPGGPLETFFSRIFRDLSILCKYLNLSPKNFVITKTKPDGQHCDIIVVFNKKFSYHPLVTALRNNGYMVRVTTQFTPDLYAQAKIIVFIPDKGFPLDIMFYDEEKDQNREPSPLKVFLLDSMPQKSTIAGLPDSEVLFLDRKNLDLRFVLLTLDRFLGTVVTPEKEDVTFPDDQPQK